MVIDEKSNSIQSVEEVFKNNLKKMKICLFSSEGVNNFTLLVTLINTQINKHTKEQTNKLTNPLSISVGKTKSFFNKYNQKMNYTH